MTREEHLARCRSYYLQHKTALLKKRAVWFQKNKLLHKALMDKWRLTNISPERKTFMNMRQRCENPSHISYSRYGGRGIKLLYASFDEFFGDVGYKPSKGHSVDRIDNNGNYEKGNCRWATAKEQAANRRKPS